MGQISKRQIIAIKATMAKLDVLAESTLLALEHSNGRTGKVSELTDFEARSLYERLQMNVVPPEDKMKRKVLSMAHELGWKLDNGKIDMARVNAWCVKYGQYHKRLDAHNTAQLAALVTQFEHAYKHFLKTF